MSSCACGCGRRIGGIRLKAVNAALGQVAPIADLLEGAARDEAAAESLPALTGLALEGRVLQRQLTSVLHGEQDRGELDGAEVRAWTAAATSVSTELHRLAAARGFQGPAIELAPLVFTGVHVSGRVVTVDDTGTTVNTQLRLRIEVEVDDAAGRAVPLRQTVLVARTAVPRVGEAVEVAHDPSRPEAGFAFRVG